MVERENQGVQLIEKLLQRDDGAEDINKLCDVIRETSFQIHKFLRSGHLEKIYENALAHRLIKIGIQLFNSMSYAFSTKTAVLEVISV